MYQICGVVGFVEKFCELELAEEIYLARKVYDKNSFFDAFGLRGLMSRRIDVKYQNKRFNESTNSLNKNDMFRHIIKGRLDARVIPKELTTTMPMEYFKPYFHYIVYGLNVSGYSRYLQMLGITLLPT